MEWVAGHWGDLLVGGVLLAVVALVIAGMVRKHRAGGGCCGCSGCPHRCRK